MLTGYLIPEAFKDSMWYNIAIFQLYLSIFISILYFGREFLILSIEHMLSFVLILITQLWTAITVSLTRIIELPVNIVELMVIQYFPLKQNRTKILDILKEETGDEQLYNLINSGLLDVRMPSDMRKLEKSIVQYTEGRQYIYENTEINNYPIDGQLSTVECI